MLIKVDSSRPLTLLPRTTFPPYKRDLIQLQWLQRALTQKCCIRIKFCIRIKKFADSKISGYVWMGPHLTCLPTTMFPTGHPSAAIAFRRMVATYPTKGLFCLLAFPNFEFQARMQISNRFRSPVWLPRCCHHRTCLKKRHFLLSVTKGFCYQSWVTFLDKWESRSFESIKFQQKSQQQQKKVKSLLLNSGWNLTQMYFVRLSCKTELCFDRILSWGLNEGQFGCEFYCVSIF